MKIVRVFLDQISQYHQIFYFSHCILVQNVLFPFINLRHYLIFKFLKTYVRSISGRVILSKPDNLFWIKKYPWHMPCTCDKTIRRGNYVREEHNIRGKTPVLQSLFYTVADLKACYFIRKRRFPVNIAIFSRKAFLWNTCGSYFWRYDILRGFFWFKPFLL